MKFTSSTLLAITAFIGLFSLSTLTNPDGFLSISCGASENRTGEEFQWIADSLFINFRNNFTKPPLSTIAPYQYQSVAYFTNLELNKYCYLLPVMPHKLLLVRTTFLFEGFEDLPLASIFDLIIDGIKWQTVRLKGLDRIYYYFYEIILLPKSETLSLCLARNSQTEDGNYVFISTIELRPLQSPMYNSTDFNNNALVYFSRRSFGDHDFSRYPEDRFDRIWLSPAVSTTTTNISTNSSLKTSLWNQPPLSVLEYAIATQVGEDLLIPVGSYYIVPDNGSYYIALYFCNIINETSPSRNQTFQIFVSNRKVSELKFPSYLNCREWYHILKLSPLKSIDIRLHPLEGSDMRPFINAAEVYRIIDINNITHTGDVLAIRKIANTANVPDDWIGGDPCLPAGFPITGVTCNEENPPRVIIVNLTNRGLIGHIPPSIANLTAITQLLLGHNNLSSSIPNLSSLKNLRKLQLQNNQLTGDIPSSLEKLPMLNELFLQNNKLDGDVPPGLIKPGLNLRVYPQSNSPINKERKEKSSIIGSAVGCSVLLIVLIFGIYLWGKKYNRGNLTTNNFIMQPQHSTTDGDDPNEFHKLTVEYTEEDIKAATNNYSTLIGKGGFGSVFYGKLSGNEVAVKVLSTDSFQGKQEFRNEVSLLSRIYHKNLVYFIGYCRKPIVALVYEFMECGTLMDHLHGPAKLEKPLDWQTRVNIALQAAEGLLYLHEGCSPPIIHRDIKCSNILLDRRMFAKISDFGLSKLLDNSKSYISTNVKGTLGYLDPEYFGSSSLNEKSDIYSFGVVLLEIISGVPPKEGIVERAKELLTCGRLVDLMDSSLGGRYSLISARKVAEIAYNCVERTSINRPTMNTVVKELAEAKACVLDDNGESRFILSGSSNVLDMPEDR
ncbi:hypothetical protein SUGI_0065820 [Cryptomeria japonica]|uniref:probable LRR receptor-like serine/threonine-protein kinase At1g67720 isoform X1 n=1 Tax=Cryptomeria japonica TaxID=3369 RepID=UPI00240897BD|nr:probable LRR receptor-like serine/threonine-protein kinase At1g67720 isoform X1 [Cryptomeria japonica]GLJ07388.1 hypothetical protein SUGI_0065820 [Cryptomeria japonica]